MLKVHFGYFDSSGKVGQPTKLFPIVFLSTSFKVEVYLSLQRAAKAYVEYGKVDIPDKFK